jgi:hypothetical protein
MSISFVRLGTIFGLTTLLGLTSATTALTSASSNPNKIAVSNSLKVWEDSLRGSTWVGNYKIESRNHSTTLEIKSVESGFIGGIVTHKNVDGAYLQVKVAGDIIPQCLIDIDNDGKAEWIDKDQLTSERVKQLVAKEERLLIRLKRFRALEVRSANNIYQWHQNREYRLRLIDGQLSGSVGIPPKNYGDGPGTTEQGVMTLRKSNL